MEDLAAGEIKHAAQPPPVTIITEEMRVRDAEHVQKGLKRSAAAAERKAAALRRKQERKRRAFEKGMKKLGDPSVPLSKLTGPEWKAVLAAAADGTIKPSTPGGALPSAASVSLTSGSSRAQA